MKIAYDAKRLFHNNTGLGNYSRNLVDGLSKYSPENDYILISNKINQSGYYHDYKHLTLVDPQSKFSSLHRSIGIYKDINDVGADIYHGLSNELPLTSAGFDALTIVTIHDLFYESYPKDFSSIDRFLYKKKTEIACKVSDKIIAISEATKADILKYIPVPESKIEVIYQTCNELFQSNSPIEPNELTDHLPDRFMLQVGTINYRKNVLSVIKAMAMIEEEKQIDLVIVGGGNVDFINHVKKEVASLGLQKRIHFFGHLDNKILRSLYKNAMFTTLPSFYEGFGIPIIESLFSGTPVLSSITSSLPEATGNCGYLADPNDLEDIRNGILKLSHDKSYRAHLISLIPEHLKKFTSENTATQMTSLYKRILNKPTV